MAAVPERRNSKPKRIPSVRATAIKKGVLIHEVDEGSPCLRCGGSCPGFSLHFWRKVCKNCLCPREEHDVREETDYDAGLRVGRILFSPTADTLKRGEGSGAGPSPRHIRRSVDHGYDSPSLLKKQMNYVWVPKCSSMDIAVAYFNALPANKTPIKGTPGERYRQKQLIRQVPAHDIDMVYCNDLSDEEKKQMELFLRLRKEIALGKGDVRIKDSASAQWSCQKCQEPLKEREVGVFADRAGINKCWHPACFTCFECEEILVDLIYFWHDKDRKIYCGRHHAEKLKPRCAACDELILCREYTRAEDQDWHLDHFCCLRCDEELGGKEYRPQDGMPFCLSCYEISFATICITCGKPITLDQSRLAHEQFVWHGTDECFRCEVCKKPLVEKAFLPKYGKVFCSKDHAKQYRSKTKQ